LIKKKKQDAGKRQAGKAGLAAGTRNEKGGSTTVAKKVVGIGTKGSRGHCQKKFRKPKKENRREKRTEGEKKKTRLKGRTKIFKSWTEKKGGRT